MTTARPCVVLLLLVVVGLHGLATPIEVDTPSSVPALRVEGRQFVDESGRVYIPRWVSGLTLLARTPVQQAAFLDWAVAAGFNGVRVFAGALTWAGQTPTGARAALPRLLDRAAERGLVVEVTALTDTGTGYDARAHLQGVVDILSGRRGVVLELANEVGNPTQASYLTAERLRAWGQEIATPQGVVWAIGAADTDALVDGQYPTHGGAYITAHLDRGGAMWSQIARVRVMHEIAKAHGVPVINNEPMGADERPGRETGRQRWNDPAGFFALGALDRAFSLGGVHHSQAGLMAEIPGPVQQRCAAAYVEGHRTVEAVLGGAMPEFHLPGEAASPVASTGQSKATAVYSFAAGQRGVTVLVGLQGDPDLQWASGWRPVRVVASMRADDGTRVDVLEIARAPAAPDVT